MGVRRPLIRNECTPFVVGGSLCERPHPYSGEFARDDPLSSLVDSLNVSVAAALFIRDLVRSSS